MVGWLLAQACPGSEALRPNGSEAEPIESRGTQAVRHFVIFLATHILSQIVSRRCCACPQTKSARDDCFLRYDSSEATEKCKELVQAHIACMRGYGFKV